MRRDLLALSQVSQRHGGVQLAPVRAAFTSCASFGIAPDRRALAMVSDVSCLKAFRLDENSRV